TALLATLCAAACACQPGTDEAAAPSATDADAGPVADTPPSATATPGAFTCTDGTRPELDWGRDEVVVRWPDGRTATLPRAASASGPDGDGDGRDTGAGEPDGDAYVGDTVSVEHDGGTIVVHDGGNAPLACDATGDEGAAAAVAMRYACEPDTEVVVFEDGRARVALPDGQEVDLSRVTGSSPPVYTGGTLFFTVGDNAAHLSQGDRTNELACSPA